MKTETLRLAGVGVGVDGDDAESIVVRLINAGADPADIVTRFHYAPFLLSASESEYLIMIRT